MKADIKHINQNVKPHFQYWVFGDTEQINVFIALLLIFFYTAAYAAHQDTLMESNK